MKKGGSTGNEGTQSKRRDTGNEGTQPMGSNQQPTMDFMQVTRQHRNPESSRESSKKRSVESAFGRDDVSEPDSPKRSKATEASAITSWEGAKEQLLKQQREDIKRLKRRYPDDRSRQLSMEQYHNEQRRRLLVKKPEETISTDAFSSLSLGVSIDIARVREMQKNSRNSTN